MVRYQYLMIRVEDDDKISRINGKSVKPAPLMVEFLQKMSDEGWELVTAGSFYISHNLYFRKPALD